MAFVVTISNFLVQFPVNYLGLKVLLTYGAFSYPVAFFITDLSKLTYNAPGVVPSIHNGS